MTLCSTLRELDHRGLQIHRLRRHLLRLLHRQLQRRHRLHRQRLRNLDPLRRLDLPHRGHRHHRVLRQHLPLFEFLTAMTANAGNWLPSNREKPALTREAISHWFGDTH